MEFYARAIPELIEVTESIEVTQEISRSPHIAEAALPAGRISIRLPYDGYLYFSRTALKDVEGYFKRATDPEVAQAACCGHLAFIDHERTDLHKILHQSGRIIALPIRIPVRSAYLKDSADLVSDHIEFNAAINYNWANEEADEAVVE